MTKIENNPETAKRDDLIAELAEQCKGKGGMICPFLLQAIQDPKQDRNLIISTAKDLITDNRRIMVLLIGQSLTEKIYNHV